MHKFFYSLTIAAAIVSHDLSSFAASEATPPDHVAPATPTDILLKTVRIGQGVNVPGSSSNQPRARLIFANAENQPLYVYDKDVVGTSSCNDECTKIWPPAIAPPEAKPVGDWSLVSRDNGSYQWAFRGKPLYSYSEDKVKSRRGGGGAKGHGVDGVWHIFEVEPKEWLTLPTGVSVEEIYTAPGQVMVDARGMPLYVFSGDLEKTKAELLGFSPFVASQLALPIGDFSVVARNDGIHQWALNEKPLFTYDGDVELGDSNGKVVDSRF